MAGVGGVELSRAAAPRDGADSRRPLEGRCRGARCADDGDERVARVGLEHVKKIVVEDATRRQELHQRLLFSLQDYEDPWGEAVAKPVKRREYQILEVVA